MLANNINAQRGAAPAASQHQAQFPAHISRMIRQCLEADYAKDDERRHIKKKVVPYITRHRREILTGSFEGWLNRDGEYRRDILERSKMMRSVLNFTHSQIVKHEASNVVSLLGHKRKEAH